MSAKLIQCERCLVKSGAAYEPENGDTGPAGRPVEFYREDDGQIHCGQCVDGEIEKEEDLDGK